MPFCLQDDLRGTTLSQRFCKKNNLPHRDLNPQPFDPYLLALAIPSFQGFAFRQLITLPQMVAITLGDFSSSVYKPICRNQEQYQVAHHPKRLNWLPFYVSTQILKQLYILLRIAPVRFPPTK